MGIIPGAGKPVAAILPPRIGWIGFGPERVAVPAGIDSIKLDRDFVVVNPLDVSDLVVDRLDRRLKACEPKTARAVGSPRTAVIRSRC